MEWILASGSPRRKELLAELLEKFEIIPSAADENVEADSPKALVELLSLRKASEVALRKENEGKMVIGSDTVVALENQVLGKPKDEGDAIRMLTSLSARAHEVYTGVSFVQNVEGTLKTWTCFDCTKVHFRALSKEWIETYVAGGSPMDKAGAYGIQDGGLVEKIEGSYTNVVGFPVELLQKMIERTEEEGL